MRLAVLLFAACLGLTGCATIKSWFGSTPPDDPPAAPAVMVVPAVQPEQPEEPALKQTSQPPISLPRAVPPAPEPRRPSAPPAPRPAAPAAVPPPPPAPRVTPEPPPPVLSPVLSAVDEQKLRTDTQRRIDGAAQRLRQIDPAKLASGEQESLQTVQSFLDKAREALQAQDIQRAFTLADKAYLLAGELTKR